MKVRRSTRNADGDAALPSDGAPGKTTAAQKRYAGVVQRVQTSTATPNSEATADIAQRGVANGGGEPLPFFGAIQTLFGRHDISDARAHTGSGAGQAARAIGAKAYTTGKDVAFDGTPDLHTAAHEAAHVVQQRAGVQLSAKVGTQGDVYEQHADAVADRVVAGKSAEGVLDEMAPGASSGGAATHVQRKEVRADDKHAGSNELQKILQTGTREVVTAAYKALRKARGERQPPAVLDTISFRAGGNSWHLQLAHSHTDAMVPAFSRRLKVMDAQEAGKPVSDKWTKFAEKFNQKLKSVLHAFDLDAKGTETPAATAVAAARLQFLFTDGQRQKLMSFFETNLIPERLFNGDEVGRATAQQRIVLAGHILGTGKYKEGSFEQKLHAKMCYHFARLVWLYAGATPAGGQNTGVMGGFDHSGAAVFGGGSYEELLHAKRDSSLSIHPGTAQAEKHGSKAYRFGMAKWEMVNAMQPGDWLYIYNANASSTGAHSIIFGGWVGPVQTEEEEGEFKGKRFREARVFDQGSPKAGGKSRTKLLGEDFFMHGSRPVNPVNQIWRVDPDNAPINNVDDLSPELKKAVRQANHGFVKKLKRKRVNRGKELSVDLFKAYLRHDNAMHIITLLTKDGVLTEKQIQMLLEANRSEDLHDLVCLNQRVQPVAHNATVLEENTKKALEGTDKKKGVEEKYDEAKGEADAEQAKIEAKISQYVLEATQAEIELMPLQLEHAMLDRSGELKQLRAEFKRVDSEKRSTKDKARRNELREQRKRLIDAMRAVRDSQKATKKERRELTKEMRALKKRASTAWIRAHSWESKLEKVERTLPYVTAHAGPLRGKDDRTKVTGRYKHLHEGVPWNSFMVEEKAAEPGD